MQPVMTPTLKLRIVTPQGVAYENDVELVSLRAPDGQISILPMHTRLMTQILPGELMVRQEGRDQFLAVGEGLVEITGETIAIATDMAIAVENIDEAKLEEAYRRAEARLRDKISDEEVASVNASLARSLAQLHVKRRRRSSI